MGVLSNVKDFLKKKAVAAASAAADEIDAASQLSPRQIQEIEERRQKYLAEMPNMTGQKAEECIRNNLGAIGIEVYQDYLAQLRNFYCPVKLAAVNFDPLNRIRYCDITKWVNSPDNQYVDKLSGVYQVLSRENCNVALIYHRTKEQSTVTLAVANTDANQADPAQADAYLNRIVDTLRGNFPGIEIRTKMGKETFGSGLPESLQSAIRVASSGRIATNSVAAVSNLASGKSKEYAGQGVEKLLDSVVPHDDSEAYTLVLLASRVSDAAERKARLNDIKTALSPYETWQKSDNYSENVGEGSNADMNVNAGANAGGQGGFAHQDGEAYKQLSKQGDGRQVPLARALLDTVKEGVGVLSRPSISSADSIQMGFQAGVNFGVNFSRASNINIQLGKVTGTTQTITNHAVKDAIEMAQNQTKRLDEGFSMGMWDFCAYVISESSKTAADVACNYYAQTQGEASYMAAATIYLWDGQRNQNEALPILESIQKVQHPIFSLKPLEENNRLMYPTLVTPSVCITGRELARAMNFPQKSVGGVPVQESIPFGREVHRYGGGEETAERNIVMGHIHHMGRTEGTPVTLDVDSLASHVFITGTTGSGKSNTVYQMLDKLQTQGVKFLVVEPAKGEYKKVFGGKSHVYGTNTAISDLLRINPFSFPDNISVAEHIDRLVEIFNACWPMYAAMPAILKEAIERSYEKVGWNLDWDSCSPRQFPTFTDLIETLQVVLSSSLYSDDTKNDYSGALVTRVRSLTNGISGQIFCGKRELTCEKLFENNVIIDLSRTSSVETKSLVMGIIVMKLQEYRMHLDRMNEKLLHVTILEEAHNLLRKTSVTQSQESANLQGQSVKMITDSIAEMRTYGEGFFIADQAPSLLDETVIRNTNTKIVLRLPAQADREAVGSAMALKDEQIQELAKLPTGVAAVYQSDWTETVLCRIDRFPDSKVSPLKYIPKDNSGSKAALEHFFKKVFSISDNYELREEDVDTIEEWISRLREKSDMKNLLSQALSGRELTQQERQIVAYNIFGGGEIAGILSSESEPAKAIQEADRKISSYLQIHNSEITVHVRQLMIQALLERENTRHLVERYKNFLNDGRVR